MFSKNKNRLYLVLERKPALPGYFWSIMLAPADDKLSTTEPDTIKWTVVEGPPQTWSFFKEMICLATTSRIIVRLCVNKFSPGDEEMRDRINHVLKEIPVEKDGQEFRSRLWAVEGIERLHAAGLAVHNLTPAEVENRATEMANSTAMKLLRQDIAIERVTDIPTEDIRW
jgi:hypothetical protein